MASAYPAGLDSFATNKANATATTADHPAHHNDLADAVNKIEAELGVIPSASSANVADRFIRWLAPYRLTAGHAEDVLWQGDLASFTDVVISGSHILIETDGYLSAKFGGQSADDFSGRYKARTFAVGDSFAVGIRCISEPENYTQVGVVFSDGIVTASNGVSVGVEQSTATTSFIVGRSGVLNAMTTVATPNVAFQGLEMAVKLTYTGANAFLASYGNGVSWLDGSAIAKTMTPTHIGLYFSKSVNTGDSLARFAPLCRLA